ncbi:hypothetical protein BH10PSE17_BH10PSE17_00370 [soil metagenome]
MTGMTDPAPAWVLLGSRHGDNQQLLAIADALQLPTRVIRLTFNPAASLPPALLRAGHVSWRTETPLTGPWPRLVLAAGRKSAAAALWIRDQSGGRTRLVHVNRPWAPLSWFDLVVTTPQYALPARVNVLSNLMPFVRIDSNAPATWPAALVDRAAALPRPWTAVMVGGDSRPYVLDDSSAARLADQVNAQVRDCGGSAWILASPRTPDSAMTIIGQRIAVPSEVIRWGHDNPYAVLREQADRFIVTADSASMLCEAVLTDRPVTAFALSTRPDWRWRLASTWRRAASRAPNSLTAHSYEAAVDLGLVASVRDLGLLQRALEAAGLLRANRHAREFVERERSATLQRIASLLRAGS